MKILVKGNSGCSIEIVQSDSDIMLQKSTSNTTYIPRLLKQFQKQTQFKFPQNSHIKVPRIYEVQQKKDSVVGKMEYVYSKNFINFFESTGFEQVNLFVETIINFLEHEISIARPHKISSTLLTNKLDAIKNNLSFKDPLSRSILDRAKRKCECYSNIVIPTGICHGDLTLSNILFNGSDCFLIDFLDSFVETPLQDIVKIRQDTYFGWSQLMSRQAFDKIRLNIIMRKIDSVIDSHFQRYDWYNQYYQIFQIVNLCRILPYAKTKKIRSFLLKNISQLLDKGE